MSKEPGIIEETKDAIMDDQHSIDEKAPGTPFMLVALSYLAVLAVVCGLLALIMWVL
ncbi:hypothetical protein Pla22_25410 [Rubripirellula amarantea]|uniref:Uncharacterized protein n=1 Tax=Rubripirellula amarantea TaxID=2527999 RepID=A0A5C5WVX5_9BACT|nr:hypothetical protein [Rubripirellula amarantea]TWT54887.1 hypothetical protein Pla22_25410 [Rubripirellula amarantea]